MHIEELLQYLRIEDDYNKAMRQLEIFLYNERHNSYTFGYDDGYTDCQKDNNLI